MPTFACRSIDPNGLLVDGRIIAGTRDSALEQLRARGHLPVLVSESIAGAKSRTPFFKLDRGTISDKQLLMMNKELSLLLGAGQQLEQALSLITKSAPSSRIRRALTQIRENLRSGSSFADALEANGQFPPLFVAMARAGEAGGTLDQAIDRMGQLLDRSVRMRDTVISALLYPAVLVGVAILSIGLLLNFVVPQFAILFEGTEATLPWITQLVLWSSTWIQQFGLGGLLFVLVLIVLLPRAKAWLRLDAWWDRAILRLPVIGELVAVQQTARFARTLSSLQRSGVPLPTALALSSKVVRNRAIATTIEAMRTSVREGRTLSSALSANGPIPALAAHLIQVGEDGGRLDDVLLQVSDIYDAKFELAVKRLLAILEPACVIVLGIFIGGIIVAILLAVISANELAL